MKKILKKLTAFAMAAVLSIGGISAQAASFTDVKPGAWYYNAVQYSSANNLFAGTSATTFSPDAAVTRGMFVTVLGKMSKINTSDYLNNRYTDVNSTAYYAPYIEWATTYGIVSGTGNNKFEPESKITRQQMATILYNYADVAGNDTSYDTIDWAAMNQLFPVNSWWQRTSGGQIIDSWAEDAMFWCASNKVLSGSNGKFYPQNTATRAECVQILYNSREVITPCTTWTARYDADGHYDPNGNYDANGWLKYLPNGKPVTAENVTAYIDTLRVVLPEGIGYIPEKFNPGFEGAIFTCGGLANAVWQEIGTGESGFTEDDYTWDEIQPGDQLEYADDITNGHVVVVVEKTENELRLVEGNYGKNIHWDRIITKEKFENWNLHSRKWFY